MAKAKKKIQKKTAEKKSGGKKQVIKKSPIKKTAEKKPAVKALQAKVHNVEASLMVAEKELKNKKIIKNIRVKSSRSKAKNITVKSIKRTIVRGLWRKKTPAKKTSMVMARKAYAEAPQNLPVKKRQKTVKIIRGVFRKSPHIINLKETEPARKEFIIKEKAPIKIQKSAPLLGKIFADRPAKEKKSAPALNKKNFREKFNFSSLGFRQKTSWNELLIVNIFQLLAVGILALGSALTGAAEKIACAIPSKKIVEGTRGYFGIIKNILTAAAGFITLPFAALLNIFKHEKKTRASRSHAKFFAPAGWIKKLAVFFLIAIFLTLPLRAMLYYDDLSSTKTNLLNKGKEALGHLESAGGLSLENLKQANMEFKMAIDAFSDAEEQTGAMNTLLINIAALLPVAGDEAKTGKNILQAGKNIAQAGEIITRGFAPAMEDNSLHLTKKIDILKDNLTEALPLLTEANETIRQSNALKLPEEYQNKFIELGVQLPLLISNAENFVKFSEVISTILGDEETKRYLVFFQNNAELRPTGGFLGSFALLDIDRGEIKNLEIPSGGTYDMNGRLKERLLAPEPMHLVNTQWELQDANWFPDFPASARKMMWFYERSGGPSVDGVITLIPNVVEKLLQVIGPINMTEKYGEIIDENNFWEVVQREAEKKYYVTKESKKIIGEMAPELIEKILNSPKNDFIKILSALNSSLEEKEILFYFNDEELQKTVLNFGWGGEIKNSSGDYLAVIDTNISGGKTDRQIDTAISHEAEISEDGTVIDMVTITKKHNGARNAEFWGVKNMDYLRVYVPRGSELLEAQGFLKPPADLFEEPAEDLVNDADLLNIEKNPTVDKKTNTTITEEFGKTVFGNWLEIEPGSTTIVSLKYKLPFKIKKEEKTGFFGKLWGERPRSIYSLFIQKQPGTSGNLFSNIKLPQNDLTVWKYPYALAADEGNSWKLETDLKQDKFIGLILK